MQMLWPPNICQHTFLPLLDERSVVIDLGANDGTFTHSVISRFGCRVVALEALPDLAASIPRHPNLTIFQEAIAGKTGSIQINRYAQRCASSLGPMSGEIPNEVITVKSVSFHDLLQRTNLQNVDLLKVDVEGAELAMFDTTPDEDLLICNQITVEFHDFLYPETHEHVERIKRRLGSLGFKVVPLSLDNTDVLFINESARVSFITLLWLKTAIKYGRGIRRRLTRALQQ